MVATSGQKVWAQGRLQLFSGPELVERLAAIRFTGRLALISAGAAKRVVALHMADGSPVVALASGVSAGVEPERQAFRARQLLLEALTWSMGSFRIDEMPVPESAPEQALGTAEELLAAARQRAELWPGLTRRLPGPFGEVSVSPGTIASLPDDPVEQAVLQVLDGPLPLREIGVRCGADDHLVLKAVLALAARSVVSIGLGDEFRPVGSGRLEELLPPLLAALDGGSDGAFLKIAVVAWDARTAFRSVQALLGRPGQPPADIENLPQYRVIQERGTLPGGIEMEVLGFRSDTFEPEIAAPLVTNCHLLLLVNDMENGPAPGSDQSLAERVNAVRDMFPRLMAAGRVTVGAGSVTNPGCDVLIPEIARYVSWEEVEKTGFLEAVLREVAWRLGIESQPESAFSG